jgi:hypothetical protein
MPKRWVPAVGDRVKYNHAFLNRMLGAEDCADVAAMVGTVVEYKRDNGNGSHYVKVQWDGEEDEGPKGCLSVNICRVGQDGTL